MNLELKVNDYFRPVLEVTGVAGACERESRFAIGTFPLWTGHYLASPDVHAAIETSMVSAKELNWRLGPIAFIGWIKTFKNHGKTADIEVSVLEFVH